MSKNKKLTCSKIKKYTKCECCFKKIEKFGNRKFCSSCAIYNYNQRNKISYLNKMIHVLKKKLYGQKDGRQRIR